MGVRELPSGRFQSRVVIDGRSHQATHETREEAENWEVLIRAQHLTGNLPTRTTVREYAARWMTGYANAPTNTRRFHQSNLDLWVLPKIGRRPMSAIKPTDITRLINEIRDEGTVATADTVYRTLSALFHAAEQDDVVVKAPIRSKRHRPKRQKRPHAVLERVQARELLLQMGGWQRDTALLQLGLGARFSEIAGLTPHDVDLRRGVVRIERRVSTGTVRATKNHRARELELPRSTLPTLRRLLDTPQYPPPPLPDLEEREWPASTWIGYWLVQTATGRPPCLSAFNKALKAAAGEVGAPIQSSHGLRHTYVSWMIDDGYTTDQIAFWIGDTPETVQRVYAHMLEGSSAPAAASIDRALGDLG